MVINSTNINKMNNRLSKEKQKKTMIYDFGNPGPGLGQAQRCGRDKTVNEIPTHIVCFILLSISQQGLLVLKYIFCD
jgi:hypothetical protein